MAQLGDSMRLTVDVLPLAEENSHGPYRDVALEAFKGRKFALPVQLDDTFEKVWGQIEERYKRNYLTPTQASSFTIKVLQDSYDCDLDLSDTVRSIFSGETDPSKRMIKVVPSFVYRDFSVPPTSNLRPANAQKRAREAHTGRANKRRRLENTSGHLSVEPDHPITSTEDERSTSDNVATAAAGGIPVNYTRSKSNSIVPLGSTTTGRDEFGPPIKEESPELGLSTVRTIPESEQPSPVKPVKANGTALNRALSPTREEELGSTPSHAPSPEAASAQDAHESAAAEETEESDENSEEGKDEEHVPTRANDTPESEYDDKTYQHSPESSSPEHVKPSPSPQRAPRKDPYELSPSPEIAPRPLLKPKNTYSRKIRTSARLKPNGTRRSTSAQPPEESAQEKIEQAVRHPSRGPGSNPRAFQLAKPDDIVSTPDEAAIEDTPPATDADVVMDDRVTPAKDVVSTPLSNGASASAKTSSLKKPTRKFTKMPPPKMAPLVASGDGAKAASTVSAEPAMRRTSQSAAPNEANASTPARGPTSMTSSTSGATTTPKLSALDKIRLVRENASRMRRASSTAPSQASQSRQSSVLRSQSPKVQVEEKADSQPWKLLNAARKAAAEKSPIGVGHPSEDDHKAPHKEQAHPPVAASTSNALPANTKVFQTPKQSPIPPPPVRTTPVPAPQGTPSTAKSAATTSDVFKIPAKKTAVSTPNVKPARHDEERREPLVTTSEVEAPRSDTKAGSVEPKRTPIPAPGDANFLTPTSVPKPRRQSTVPLPENVRDRFPQGTVLTPAQASASLAAKSKSPIPLPGASQGIASATSQASASVIGKSRSPIPLPSTQKQTKKMDNAVPAQSAYATARQPPNASQSGAALTHAAVEETICISSASSDSEEFTSSDIEEEEEVKQQKPDIQMAEAGDGEKVEEIAPETDADSLPDADQSYEEDAAPALQSAQTAAEDKSQQKPWTKSTWGFEGISEQRDIDMPDSAQHDDIDVPDSAQKPVPSSPEEPAPGSTTEPDSEEEDEEQKQIEQEEEQAIQQEIAAATKSPSPTPSSRSSPDTTLRQPARYLSRSPTPETDQESSDEDEEEEDAPPSPKAAADASNEQIDETDSSDSSSDSSSEDEEEDLSTLDVSASSARPGTQPATQPPQSSMPSLISTPTPLPSASQPLRRAAGARASLLGSLTQIPGNLSRTPSSQRITAAQPQSARPLGRASTYLKPREQLQRLMSDSQQSRSGKPNGSFDPSRMSLGSLKAKQAGKASLLKTGKPASAAAAKAAAAKMFDDDSDDDSSSSSSSSDDEDGGA